MANSAFTKKFSVRLSYTVSAFPDDYVEMLLSRRHKDSYNCETPQKKLGNSLESRVSSYTTPPETVVFSREILRDKCIENLKKKVLGLLAHVTPSNFFSRILKSEALVYSSYNFF